mmetsp:Transcript_42908/g.84301  ORF Transcript_42908/g.84301 Transcript_42908/m.84301 type:complete len:86 (-) Transcript_42908:39-296(-)
MDGCEGMGCVAIMMAVSLESSRLSTLSYCRLERPGKKKAQSDKEYRERISTVGITNKKIRGIRKRDSFVFVVAAVVVDTVDRSRS